jgi:hypothetical protein
LLVLEIGLAHEVAPDADARVVDQNIERPTQLLDRGIKPLRTGWLRQIGNEGRYLDAVPAAGSAHLLGRVSEPRRTARCDEDVVTFSRKNLCKLEPDAVRSSGDEDKRMFCPCHRSAPQAPVLQPQG